MAVDEAQRRFHCVVSRRWHGPRMRCLVLVSLLICAPLPGRGEDRAGSWYLNPYLGGIAPDKPWGSKGSSALFGLDVGMHLSQAWSAELDLNDAPLSDRFGSGRIELYGGALELLRTFTVRKAFAPYVSIGTGLTHLAPPSGIALESRTEFMVQPGVGAFVNLWESGDRSRSVSLRPDIKLRWTHGWAHAPGNPVDPLYVLGVTLSL
jgi:hypothetical protein